MKKAFISNLQSRRLNKFVKAQVIAEAEKKERIALEEFAINLKNRGIQKLEGENYIILLK